MKHSFSTPYLSFFIFFFPFKLVKLIHFVEVFKPREEEQHYGKKSGLQIFYTDN